MVFVNRLLILLFIFCGTFTFAQKTSDKLRKEQERLEKNIAQTKSLLDKTKSSSQATLNELKIIDNQIKYREKLLNNFDNQIRNAELKIEQKDQQVVELEARILKLKEQYRQLLIYAYKHRSVEGKMMYVFSASSYYEALKRNKYLQKVAEIQEKQRLIILQNTKLIQSEKISLQKEKELKSKVADEKRLERQEILKDKVKQQSTFQALKGEESKLTAELIAEEKKKAVVQSKIKEAIEREILAAEKLRKEKAAAAEKVRLAKVAAAKLKAEKDGKAVAKPTVEEKIPAKPEPTIAETKEVALNKSFETNKGRLPWPVTSGSITEGYGSHPHPTLPNVTIYNNGIDISAPKSAQVRSVFDGEVTSVLSIPGAGKVVIIKHGNYRTVYGNLQETYVSVGTTVSTKQAIGSLLPLNGQSLSVSHFEIHLVQDGKVVRINPSLWIAN
jgi:septal ring factor EnvC (AmiA/AmiB activator)